MRCFAVLRTLGGAGIMGRAGGLLEALFRCDKGFQSSVTWATTDPTIIAACSSSAEP